MTAVLARLRHEWRLLAVALQFLTRVPVPTAWIGREPWQSRWLSDGVRHFPLVGMVVGALVAAVLAGAAVLWTPTIAALLAVAFGALLTGAFHEDGLADTFDALGGSAGRERALEIMKDSRLGSYGTLALGLVTALRIAALAAIVAAQPRAALLACVWTHAIARWASVAVMSALPYGGDAEHAKAKPLALGVPWTQALQAGLWVLLLAAALTLSGDWMGPGLTGGSGRAELQATWVAALIASACAVIAVAVVMTAWLGRRLGGYTGDGLGATEQLAEAASLLALAAVLGVQP